MKNSKIKTSLVSPEGPKALITKLLSILFLLFVENCLQYNAIHDFSVWLRTGSNPLAINRFESLLEKSLLIISLL